jgi:signal transduction histidine kinase
MSGKLKVSVQIPLAIALVAATATIVSGTIIAFDAGRSLIQSTVNQLISVSEDRKSEISSYLTSIEGDLVVLAESEVLKNSLSRFSEGWRELDNPQRTLQRVYIHENPHPTEFKDEMDSASESFNYNTAHALYHPWFRTLLRDRGYYDIFLFNAKGDLIYTVYKELDFATNFVDGKWAKSSLGDAFRAARDSLSEGHVAFFDFEPYGPSHGAAASFISTPLIENGKFVGAFAVQMPIGRINTIMGKTEGLGATGETFLIGSDGKFRSKARFDEQALLQLKPDQKLIDSLAKNDAGIVRATTYTGALSEQAFTLLDFHGVRWTVVASIDISEIDKDVHELYFATAIITLAISGLAALVGIMVGRGITSPIVVLTHAMERISSGDYDTHVGSQDRRDEFGAIMRTVQIFKDGLRENQRLQADVEESRRRRLEARLERENRQKIETAREARAEELRVSLEKAEAANKAKSDFLSSMSHEFRTPLNAVLGFGQLLNSDPDDPLSENQQTAIDQILINGEQLLNSINDLLYFAQIGDEKETIQSFSVDVSEILQTSLLLTRDLSNANGVSVEIVSTELAHQWVVGERERLIRCVTHLLSNAIKYNRKDGRVIIDVVDGPGNQIRIRVTDTGIGIPPERQEEVFHPFARLGIENLHIKGYGIGLATSKRLVELMGGSIGFESNPSKGSCFWIDLDQSPYVVESTLT